MKTRQTLTLVTALALGAAAATAAAQGRISGGIGGGGFGNSLGLPAELPPDDFRWQWGDNSRSNGRGDFEIRGTQQDFQCTLNGEYSARSRMSFSEIREFENGVRTAFRFIEYATNAMNQLDYSRNLGWAVLDCVKPERDER